jgi:hypothetical protein
LNPKILYYLTKFQFFPGFNDPEDLVVSFITLSSFSKEMAFAMLNKFLDQSNESYKKVTGKLDSRIVPINEF